MSEGRGAFPLLTRWRRAMPMAVYGDRDQTMQIVIQTWIFGIEDLPVGGATYPGADGCGVF